MEIQNSEFRIQKVSRGNGELKRENGKGCSSAKNGQMGEFGALTSRWIPSEFEQAVPPPDKYKRGMAVVAMPLNLLALSPEYPVRP